MAAAFVLCPTLYGVKRLAGALQHRRYGDRGQVRGNSRTFRRITEQSYRKLCRYGVPRLFKRGTGACGASPRGRQKERNLGCSPALGHSQTSHMATYVPR